MRRCIRRADSRDCPFGIDLTYGHLIPGANISFVDRLDEIAKPADETRPQQSAAQAQRGDKKETAIPSEVADLIGGGAWTRTTDLRIMRPSL